MPAQTVLRIMPGEVRVICGDTLPSAALMNIGCEAPTRASNIEPIPAGPCKGYWMADMSPMGDDWQYCLWPPMPTRKEALQQEHDHLNQKWIHGE